MSNLKQWAQEKIAEQALVIDIESTGGAFSDEMIELAIIDLSNLEVLYSSLLKPTTTLNYHAQKVHGISHYDLRKSPYLEDQVEVINSIMESKTVISYNSAFDSRMLEQSYQKYLLETPKITWQCLMQRCNVVFGSRKLSDLCTQFNIEKGTHRAKSDALAAARLMHYLADK